MAPFKRYFPGKREQDESESDSESGLSSQEEDVNSASKAISINVPERLHQADETQEVEPDVSLIEFEAEQAKVSNSVSGFLQQFESPVEEDPSVEKIPLEPSNFSDVSESESEEESGEEESESEEEVLLKPVYIKKRHQGEEKTVDADTKESILSQIEHGIRNEQKKPTQLNEDDEDLDDTDDLDPEMEYESWKIREADRLKRDRDLLIAKEKEQEEIELQRNRDPKQVEKELFEKLQQEEKERLEKEAFIKEQKRLGTYDNRHQGAFFHNENTGINKRLAATDEKDVGKLKRAKVDQLGSL